MKRPHHDDIHMTPDVTHIHNPDVAHEASDVNIGAILKFTIGLFVLTATVFGMMWFMLRYFEQREAKNESKPNPMALSEKERLPPEPRLQLAPGYGVTLENGQRQNLEAGRAQWNPPQAEYWALRKEWDDILKNGSKDPTTGAVKSIPIDRAIEQILRERSLQSRTDPNGRDAYRKSREVPSFSSSGREMEVRTQ